MRWFRMYNEFAHDPKVQMLPEAMQRRLVMLFCIQSYVGIETLHETERETLLAFHMRISADQLTETKSVFLRSGFINDDFTLKNWEKRQADSDDSTQRVRRFREKKKLNETLQKRKSNGADKIRQEEIRGEKKEHSSAPSSPPVISVRSGNFSVWWKLWCSIRGSAYQNDAFVAWNECVTLMNEEACFLCTNSYLDSLDDPNIGFNPQNFLRQQAQDGNYQARWPKRKPNGKASDAEVLQEFRGRMIREMKKNAG